MHILPDNARIVFYNTPVNMHKSFDSLLTIIVTEMRIDPDDNTFVLFVNRKRNRVKIIYFDRGHISMLAMRLSGSMVIDFENTNHFDKQSLYELTQNLRTKKPKHSGFLSPLN